MPQETTAAISEPEAQPTPKWKIASTSVCGTSHEKLGIPCQDAHCWFDENDHILLAAIADGAGSAKHSDLGAKIATQTAVETLRHEPNLTTRIQNNPKAFHTILQKTLIAALQAVKTEAKSQDINPREFASTLIITIATPHFVATAQIGDGAVIISDQTNDLIALTTPDSGEYINQTTFLISPNAIATAQIHIYHGTPSHIAMFTDGLQMLALTMPFGKPHQPFFSPLFNFIAKSQNNPEPQLTAFLKSSRVRERTDDDLTLLLAALTDRNDATHNPV